MISILSYLSLFSQKMSFFYFFDKPWFGLCAISFSNIWLHVNKIILDAWLKLLKLLVLSVFLENLFFSGKTNLSSAHKFSWFPSYVSCPSSFLEKYPMFSSLHIIFFLCLLLFLFLYLLLENYLPHHSLHDTSFVKDLDFYPSPFDIISLGSGIKRFFMITTGIYSKMFILFFPISAASLLHAWADPDTISPALTSSNLYYRVSAAWD